MVINYAISKWAWSHWFFCFQPVARNGEQKKKRNNVQNWIKRSRQFNVNLLHWMESFSLDITLSRFQELNQSIDEKIGTKIATSNTICHAVSTFLEPSSNIHDCNLHETRSVSLWKFRWSSSQIQNSFALSTYWIYFEWINSTLFSICFIATAAPSPLLRLFVSFGINNGTSS